jgi:hypothetical protein
MASETFLEVLARTEPELFAKGAKDRKRKLREEARRRVQAMIDETEGKPALFIKRVDANPELVHEYNDSVIDAGEELEDDGDVFKSGENPDSIYATVIQKARQLRSSAPTMSEAQAVTKVLDTEPALYSRYMRAKG